jgi:hypothetical protein
MFCFDDGRAVLHATPSTSRAMLQEMPERLLFADEGSGTWNAFQVVCHLAHNEADDWVPRIKLVLGVDGMTVSAYHASTPSVAR